MESNTLKAELRDGRGRKAAQALRRKGVLPAIIYGHGKPPEAIGLQEHELELALAHGARTLEVELNGQKSQYLIKEVQYDHLGHEVVHVDLARVNMDERVQVTVGIELRGMPKGVSEGGVLEQLLAEIEVDCRVVDIPQTLHPSVSDLGIDDVLYAKDVTLPAGVNLVTDGEERVATVKTIAEAPEPEPGEEGEGGTAEPERIGRVRADDESEEK